MLTSFDVRMGLVETNHQLHHHYNQQQIIKSPSLFKHNVDKYQPSQTSQLFVANNVKML